MLFQYFAVKLVNVLFKSDVFLDNEVAISVIWVPCLPPTHTMLLGDVFWSETSMFSYDLKHTDSKIAIII